MKQLCWYIDIIFCLPQFVELIIESTYVVYQFSECVGLLSNYVHYVPTVSTVACKHITRPLNCHENLVYHYIISWLHNI